MLRDNYLNRGRPLPSVNYQGEEGIGIRNFPVTITNEDLGS